MSTSVIAVDLGATSGRVIHAAIDSSGLNYDVVHRFPNGPVTTDDGLHWNATGLFSEITRGLAQIATAGHSPVSLGIDSWAVDYGLLSGGKLLWEPFHYRDERTARGVESVHATRDHAALFARNGLQYLPFNTIYQLATEDWTGRSSLAESLLLIPDLMGWWLTGVSATEATNASTTGLVDVTTGEFDEGLISLSGAPSRLFAPLVDPGETLGAVRQEWFPGGGLNLVTVGSHDTASAVVGTPLEGSDCAYISCGTWGLVGLELEAPILSDGARRANFTNERGVDNRVRFLTNVMGLWLLNESVNHWRSEGVSESVESLVEQASDYDGPLGLIDVTDERFMPPGNMPQRIQQWAVEHDVHIPDEPVAIVASIVHSLAQAFVDALQTAQELSGQSLRQVHLTGGGSQNALLCQAVADRSGLPVIAGPTEATALGNVLVQARTAGVITGDLAAMRSFLTGRLDTRRFAPRPLVTGGTHGR